VHLYTKTALHYKLSPKKEAVTPDCMHGCIRAITIYAKATPSKFLASHFIDLQNIHACGRAGGSLSIIHYKYLHEIRS